MIILSRFWFFEDHFLKPSEIDLVKKLYFDICIKIPKSTERYEEALDVRYIDTYFVSLWTSARWASIILYKIH